jgi:Spy/CpxP family protein refolding chaperone
MKSFLRPLFAALAVGLALVPVIAFGANINVKSDVTNIYVKIDVNLLDKLVSLTADQKARAAEIFTQQEDALQAFASMEDQAIKGTPIRQNARAQIRAILMPAQQKIYDAAPQRLGGGARLDIGFTVDRLDKLVGLTAAQKVQATQIFTDQNSALLAITSEEDQTIKGMSIQQNARSQPRVILTPAQQKINDAAPQRLGGGAMQDISVVVDRLAKLVGLTAAQKVQATQIFTDQNSALLAFTSDEDRMIKGAPIRQNARAQIRSILTPEQQKIYDTSPQRLGGGAMQDAAAIASRVDKVVTLTDDQVAPVAAIYQKLADDMAALSPADRASGQGAAIWKAAKAEVRALLTPEQQQKFDTNPNGAEDMEARAFVRSILKTAPAVVARVGTVTKVTRVTPDESWVATTLVNEQPQSMKGNYVYKVEGNAGTGTFKVSWEKPSPSEPINIIKIEGSAGETIQP